MANGIITLGKTAFRGGVAFVGATYKYADRIGTHIADSDNETLIYFRSTNTKTVFEDSKAFGAKYADKTVEYVGKAYDYAKEGYDYVAEGVEDLFTETEATEPKPTSSNTKDEIIDYLMRKGIAFNPSMTKAELLSLV